MAGSMGLKTLSNPFALIGILIGLSILINVVVQLFPSFVTDFVLLSAIGNFTFGGFFEAGGIMLLVLSAIVLLSVLAFLGVKAGSGR